MRGRKPKPTHLKVIEGNPGKRPLNKREPTPASGRPQPPGHLCTEAKAEWQRVSKVLHAIGVLTTLDRAALAVYCQAWGRWVRAEVALEKMAANDLVTRALLMRTKSGNTIQNPLVGTANKAMGAVMKAASELGMTPSVRSRIEINDGSKISSKQARHPAAKFFS